MRIPAVALLLVLAACSLDLEGARCQDDTNCPNDQRCDTGTAKCVACVSDPACPGAATCSADNKFIICMKNAGSCNYSLRAQCTGALCASGCECPTNGGTIYYADANGGPDNARFALTTGVFKPAECRCRTLTEALGAAAAKGAGARVIATGVMTPPMVFTTNESLQVPHGVTLTTADTTPTPANYVIEVGAAVPGPGPVVQLDYGATLSGFTIRPAATGSPSATDAVLVNCSAAGTGVTTVSSLMLEGKGLLAASAIGNGLHLTGPCSVAADSIAVANMAAFGVFIQSSGTAGISLAKLNVHDNGDTGVMVKDISTTSSVSITASTIKANTGTTPYGPVPQRLAGGVLLWGDAPTTFTFQGNTVCGNQSDQVGVYSGAGTWRLNGTACDSTSNIITGVPATYFAVYATSPNVDVKYAKWTTDPPSGLVNNVSYSPTCGTATCP